MERKKLGLTEGEVKALLWEPFLEWMRGQTVAIDDDTGESLYYRHDVARYVESMHRRQPPVWD